MGPFEKQVAAYVRKIEDATERSVRDGVAAALSEANTPKSAGGPMPVKTGMLRGSLTVGLGAEPARVTSIRSGDAWRSELMPYRLGQDINARWTAPHAYIQEHREGNGFMRMAAARIPYWVKQMWTRYTQ